MSMSLNISWRKKSTGKVYNVDLLYIDSYIILVSLFIIDYTL